MNYYIFASDPHGTGQPWIDKVDYVRNLYPTAQVVFGGDYIDGRKDVKETVDYVRSLQADGHIALMGNHEQLMLDAVRGNEELWNINGNNSTIRSYCNRSWGKVSRVKHFKQMNKDLIDWVASLPDIYVADDNIFVHAGLDLTANNPIKDTSHEDKLWLREDYWWSHDRQFAHNPLNKTIISGHTPTALIYGYFEDNISHPIMNVPNSCPTLMIKYPSEHARLFADGGCHGNLPYNTGNVLVIDELGNIVYSLTSIADVKTKRNLID